MRSKNKTIMAALLAVFALAAIGAASASAAASYPEFEPSGKAKFPIAFSGEFGSVSFKIPATGAAYSCRSATISGEITGPKELSNVKLAFFGEGSCAARFGYGFCTSETLNTWTTNGLKGRLGYRSKARKFVGVVFEPVSGPFASCGEKKPYTEGEILGSVLSSVQPILTKTNKLTFTVGVTVSGGLEGEAKAPQLERTWLGEKPVTAIMEATFKVTTAQEVTVRA